jgi:tetratricopeptide (TPR) repeat protein
LYLPVGTWPPAGRPDLQTLATRAVAAPALLYGFTFLLVAWGGLLLGSQGSLRGLPVVRRRWSAALALVLLLGVGWATVFTNLDRSRADALSRLGRTYERAGTWDAARLVYREALRWQPGEDRYALSIGRALIEQVQHQASTPPAVRDALLAQAIASLQEAQRLNPLHPDHARNLARAHRYWADVTADPTTRAARLARAHAYYGEAARRSPNDARLQEEWAALPR